MQPQQSMSRLLIILVLLSAGILAYYFRALSTRPSIPDALGLQSVLQDWHIFYHLGGYSPWIQHHTSTSSSLPPQCVVDQVHMLSRHAERYPTLSVGIKMKSMITKLKAAGTPVFPFLESWEEFFEVDENGKSTDLEELTREGRYAGVRQAYNTGVTLRERYDHLVDGGDDGENKTFSIFSCSCSRVLHTAENFALGFFREDELFANVRHVIIPDIAPERGADTLTPVKACIRYRQDTEAGRKRGSALLEQFQSVYLSRVAVRLRQQFGYDFSVSDLWHMQELCGFEILATGNEESPWCGIFTQREWEEFAYARDLLHYYRSGPGTPYSAVMGFLYLNATREVLELGPERAGKLFFSFAHDGDIVPLVGTLGLFPEVEPLPYTYVPDNRNWKLSSVVPMGGRVVFERVSCVSTMSTSSVGVRILVNDGVVPVPGCESETRDGEICPLDVFVKLVDKKGEEVGEFDEVCGLKDGLGRRPSFLRQDWEQGPGRLHL
ncbi:histidine phosphatase superfamily [Lipomyces tetrasporus]|uniref:Histidine phosphatase superfamily n=1 Tax=Lipomyces tetrasporus TaxID=54092 RepID=A0AAD7VT09_9ASCO|nr:histidine phosphatase superfamily [Lipomyces tetrasporus]KAJ8100913.1 histidine phosphatase superfamily [Lipomyces tetrasporus]